MKEHIKKIQQAIEPYRQQIINHKVYGVIDDLNDMQIFMKYHVFAVWDFMSLLKGLQTSLTCVRVPWFPKGLADNRFLINEIVVGEEADVDSFGTRKSHYEIYLDAMDQAGADDRQIRAFIYELSHGMDLEEALLVANTPLAVQRFVKFTFNTIATKHDHLMAAVFTFGREDLIPEMFVSIINDLDKKFPGSIGIFKYYLDRHIEVDGDHHSKLALQMVENLCGTDEAKWKDVEAITIEALKKRIQLWDGVYQQIVKQKQLKPAEVFA